MRWLRLYLRARRVPLALAGTVCAIGSLWASWPHFSDGQTVNARVVSAAALIAAVAVGTTLGGADDALDHTASVNWPARRAGHVLAAAAAVVALLLVSTLTDVRFEPLGVVARNTAGLLGLTALGAALLGAALSWIAPLIWTLVALLPWLGPSDQVRLQIAAWLVQPAGTTAATACATLLAVVGLVAYALRGCPRRPAAETAPDR